MPAVVSHRVEAGPKDKLPPGAAEAEFARLKSCALKKETNTLHEVIAMNGSLRSALLEGELYLDYLDDGMVFEQAMVEWRSIVVHWAMIRSGQNQVRASRLLGINRNSMRKYLAECKAINEQK